MKKKVLFSLILAIMATMWAGTAQAQTKYELWLAGTQVTSENCGNLFVIDGVSGTVKYNDATKTLILDNATIHNTAEVEEGDRFKSIGIVTGISGLTIRLVGNNTITAEKNRGIYNIDKTILTIMGEGKLTVKGSTTASNNSNQIGILNSGTITVSGCTLEVSGGVYGLVNGHWKFDRCTVRAKGSGRSNDSYAGSISSLWSKPEFTDCAIITPEGAYWKNHYGIGDYCLYGADGKSVTDWVTIEKSAVTIYNFKIAGTQVTSANCNDLSVIDGVSGKVNYDHATKTLTLDNATISNKNTVDEDDWEKADRGKAAGIFNEVDGLTIRLVGNNTITSEKNVGVWNYCSTITFTGAGKLVVNGSTTSSEDWYKVGILNDGGIIVSGCTLEASGGVCGLARGGWKFDRCTVRAKGGGSSDNEYAGSIGVLSMYQFSGCAIATPKGAYWEYKDAHYSLFSKDNKVITDWVTIEPIEDYELWIAGTKLTLANCNDLSVIEGVSGKVMYDDNTKTLTLNNASISTTIEDDRYGRGSGIYNQIEGLTIHLIGNNTITAEKGMGVWNFKTLSFMGDGKLVVKGSTTSSDISRQKGIFNYGSITVSGCTLEASGGVYGLVSGYWTFDRCTVRAKGGGSSDDEYAGSIAWFWHKKPELNGCEIIAPTGAKWKEFQSNNNSYYSLFGTDNKVITDWVTITPDPNAIETPTADTTAKQGIYSLSGVRLQGELNNLPKGVYIVNGRKVVKK